MYMDVPPYHFDGANYFAQSRIAAGCLPPGWRRVAFVVDLPIREYDAVAAAQMVEMPAEIRRSNVNPDPTGRRPEPPPPPPPPPNTRHRDDGR